MIQLLALLAISWILIWLMEKKDLGVLGLVPTPSRIKYFAALFDISLLCAITAFLLRMYFAQERYMISPTLTVGVVFQELWNQLRMVLTEELLCRGVLLYILIRRLGSGWAILISSAAFAALHWFNAGVWGNPVQMLLVFGFTFAMGVVLAYSYSRTYSILFPLAIHLGWNVAQNFIFPDTPAGNHVFVLAAPPPEVTVSYAVLFTMLLLPKVLVLVINYLVVRKHRPVIMP